MRCRIVASHIILRSYPHLCRIGYIINEGDEKMKKTYSLLKNSIITFVILLLCFALCLVMQEKFNNVTLIPAIFVLGVFLTSVLTNGYVFGIVSALVSVIAVNFAFTFPFFEIDFTIPGNIISGLILLVVTVVTCSFTARIKKQEAIKAEIEKERMRANLLRAVSHDLRTPLTTIYSSSSALLENYDIFSEKQIIKILGGIKEDSLWLSRMVENLLSVTKLDGGNVRIIKTETLLDELVDSVLVKFNKRYPNQEVVVDIPNELIAIPMDAMLIEQVMINILENAVQHASGMKKINLKVFKLSQKVIFEISDDGCGINDDIIDHIFTGTYSKKEVPSDGNKNNSGIGLSVCAAIIKAHGGEITVENLKNSGAMLRFALDLGDDENE